MKVERTILFSRISSFWIFFANFVPILFFRLKLLVFFAQNSHVFRSNVPYFSLKMTFFCSDSCFHAQTNFGQFLRDFATSGVSGAFCAENSPESRV